MEYMILVLRDGQNHSHHSSQAPSGIDRCIRSSKTTDHGTACRPPRPRPFLNGSGAEAVRQNQSDFGGMLMNAGYLKESLILLRLSVVP